MATVRRAWSWVGHRPQLTDAAFGAGYAVFAVFLVLLEYQRPAVAAGSPALMVSIAAVVVATMPLMWRRRAPAVTLGLTTLLYVAYLFLPLPGQTGPGNAFNIALYSAGGHLPRRRANVVRLIAVAVLAGYLAVHLLVITRDETRDAAPIVAGFSLLVNGFIWGAMWVLGNGSRERRAYQLALEQRTRQLERERDERARRAIVDERLRIARELHDVVAHHVSVMGVQAAAARRVFDVQPERVVAALASIEVTSRTAVADMQRLLGMLRSDDGAESLAPQPGLGELSALVENVRAAGVPVRLQMIGRPPDELPIGVELSAYRIVQEALTNVVKHAGKTRVQVTLQFAPDAVQITVTDNGHGGLTSATANGKGLVGMRERVAMFGGDLDVGPRPEGGFRIDARIPLARS